MAAFIRTAALFLSRRKDAEPFPASVVILPFGYRAANFSDYYSEDFIRHHLHVRMPERAALICSDAEAGARALLERPMPRPQMLVYLRDNRQFAVSADGTFAVDLASYICRGKTLAEWIRTADPAPLAELFLHLSLFGGVSSFLVDAVGFPTGPVREAIRCLAPGTNLILCPMAEDENFYTFGAFLLLMRTLLNDRFPSKGDQ